MLYLCTNFYGMEWLINLFTEQTVIQAVIAISIVCALGQVLGNIKIAGLSLGLTFVFFVGILAGHLGLEIDRSMLEFAESFGLILFVYALGLQVGPGFITSLGKNGIQMNLIAMAVVVLGSAMTLMYKYIFNLNLGDLMGVLSGAVTNTPALAAAQQSLKQLGEENSDIALGCAVSYPLGVLGVILAIALLKNIFKSSISKNSPNDDNEDKTVIIELLVNNSGVFNKSIKDISSLLSKKFIVSRVWHDGLVSIPLSDTIIHEGDKLLIITTEVNVESLKMIIGTKEERNWNQANIDWNAIDSQVSSSRIVITKREVNGKKLSSFKLRNRYGVNVTRIHRSGIVLFPSPDLTLLVGDRLTVVGEQDSIKEVEMTLGNVVKNLDEPNLITVFIGMFVGLVIGSIPFTIPGISLPIKLGIAGGPIIVGILVGAYGPRIHMVTYTTISANLMLRGIGLSMYLACLGIDAGKSFFETVFRPEGLLWIGIGFTITVVPVILVALFAIKFIKMDFASTCGILCGSMSNPMALNYVNSIIDGDSPAVSYATVYPLTMFARVIIAQIMLMLFL